MPLESQRRSQMLPANIHTQGALSNPASCDDFSAVKLEHDCRLRQPIQLPFCVFNLRSTQSLCLRCCLKFAALFLAYVTIFQAPFLWSLLDLSLPPVRQKAEGQVTSVVRLAGWMWV